MATNTSSKRLATTLRRGIIKATIWQHVNEKGLFFGRPSSRPQGSVVDGTTASHSVSPIWEALMHVAFEAKEWIATHALKR